MSIWPCLAILCCPATVAAQGRFDVWTVEDGLPQGSVNDIQQTRDGYLTTDRQGAVWVHLAGAHIVRRYLGQVRHFSSCDGLPSVSTWGALFEDREGTLWFLQHLGALYRIRDGTSQIVPVKDLLCSYQA